MRLSFGSILIGLAATWLVIAYVVQPFRKKKGSADRVIEAWIAEIRADIPSSTPIESGASIEPSRYCPYCGRSVAEDHRFCPGCGEKLPADLEE